MWADPCQYLVHTEVLATPETLIISTLTLQMYNMHWSLSLKKTNLVHVKTEQ